MDSFADHSAASLGQLGAADLDGVDLVIEQHVTDADGDGYIAWQDGGDDCADSTPDIHPGHNDTKGRFGRDGVDNDCNGIIDG